MFSGSLGRALKRQVNKFLSNAGSSRRREKKTPDNRTTTNSALETKQTPEEETTVVVQQYVKKAAKPKPSSDTQLLALTGKVKTSNVADLLKIENAALSNIISILETENNNLRALLNLENPEDTNAVQNQLAFGLEQMRTVHADLKEDRKEAAVDIVELIFRSLNTRPPPRMRGDSRARTRTMSRVRTMTADRGPHHHTVEPEAKKPALSRAGTADARLSEPSLSDIVVERPGIISVVGTVDEFSTNVMRGRNRSSTISGAPEGTQHVFSVRKVNKFNKNSPHVLEIDTRTRSMVIKDAKSRSIKWELTSSNLVCLKKSKTRTDQLSIVYEVKGKSEPVKKKYQFRTAEKMQEFIQLISRNILAYRIVDNEVSEVRLPENTLDSLIIDGAQEAEELKDQLRLKREAEEELYVASPMDTSDMKVREELWDAVDAIGANLSRLWQKLSSKDAYDIPDRQYRNSHSRLRDQLRVFAGKTETEGKYNGLSLIIAQRFLLDIIHLGYDIVVDAEPTSVDVLEVLVEKLARDSNEIWCLMASLHHMKHVKPEPTPRSTPRGSLRPAVPPRPQGGHKLSARRSLLLSANYDAETEPPQISPNVTARKGRVKTEGAVPSSAELQRQTLRAVLRRYKSIRPFDKLTKKQKSHHIADATEVFRTLHEFNFSIRLVEQETD